MLFARPQETPSIYIVAVTKVRHSAHNYTCEAEFMYYIGKGQPTKNIP